MNANFEQDAKITIGVPVLNKYKMEGVGKTTINRITGQRFDLNYEGVGEVILNGKVNNFKLRARGVGGIDAKNLQAQLVEANVEGVGAVKVYAADRLNATMNGIGSLTYFGHPRSVNKNVDGIGNVSAGD